MEGSSLCNIKSTVLSLLSNVMITRWHWEWESQQNRAMLIGNQVLIGTDRCVAHAPYVGVRTLESTHEMLVESRMLPGVKI